MEKIERSNRYLDGQFLNYENGFDMSFWKVLPLLWDFIVTDNDRKPNIEIPKQEVNFLNINSTTEDELKITWIGHSSQLINIDGKLMLTDPVFEKSTAFLGPSRFNGEVPLDINNLPEIDIVLISHNHYDHLNIPTIEKIHSRVKNFIAPLMVGAELEEAGVPRNKITELDWWEERILFNDILIVFTPAQHFSGRGLFDRNKTLWGSYVIKGPKHNIYFSGDSGYFDGFRKIGDRYGPFDYTLMECGAYNERWRFVHMMPEETVKAHIDLRGKILQPMHWGTFDLALHSWYDPMIRVAKAADSLGIELSTPIVGETITINDNLVTERWWEEILTPEKLIAIDK